MPSPGSSARLSHTALHLMMAEDRSATRKLGTAVRLTKENCWRVFSCEFHAAKILVSLVNRVTQLISQGNKSAWPGGEGHRLEPGSEAQIPVLPLPAHGALLSSLVSVSSSVE